MSERNHDRTRTADVAATGVAERPQPGKSLATEVEPTTSLAATKASDLQDRSAAFQRSAAATSDAPSMSKAATVSEANADAALARGRIRLSLSEAGFATTATTSGIAAANAVTQGEARRDMVAAEIFSRIKDRPDGASKVIVEMNYDDPGKLQPKLREQFESLFKGKDAAQIEASVTTHRGHVSDNQLAGPPKELAGDRDKLITWLADHTAQGNAIRIRTGSAAQTAMVAATLADDVTGQRIAIDDAAGKRAVVPSLAAIAETRNELISANGAQSRMAQELALTDAPGSLIRKSDRLTAYHDFGREATKDPSTAGLVSEHTKQYLAAVQGDRDRSKIGEYEVIFYPGKVPTKASEVDAPRVTGPMANEIVIEGLRMNPVQAPKEAALVDAVVINRAEARVQEPPAPPVPGNPALGIEQGSITSPGRAEAAASNGANRAPVVAKQEAAPATAPGVTTDEAQASFNHGAVLGASLAKAGFEVAALDPTIIAEQPAKRAPIAMGASATATDTDKLSKATAAIAEPPTTQRRLGNLFGLIPKRDA